MSTYDALYIVHAESPRHVRKVADADAVWLWEEGAIVPGLLFAVTAAIAATGASSPFWRIVGVVVLVIWALMLNLHVLAQVILRRLYVRSGKIIRLSPGFIPGVIREELNAPDYCGCIELHSFNAMLQLRHANQDLNRALAVASNGRKVDFAPAHDQANNDVMLALRDEKLLRRIRAGEEDERIDKAMRADYTARP